MSGGGSSAGNERRPGASHFDILVCNESHEVCVLFCCMLPIQCAWSSHSKTTVIVHAVNTSRNLQARRRRNDSGIIVQNI